MLRKVAGILTSSLLIIASVNNSCSDAAQLLALKRLQCPNCSLVLLKKEKKSYNHFTPLLLQILWAL